MIDIHQATTPANNTMKTANARHRRRDSQSSQIEMRAKQTAKASRAAAHGRFEK
ncbi:MAG TPA: hypothetical protein VFL53_00550 [Pseudolabrys sp.]|nr:hypothetical protein [Pseudolabrys sp.]